MGAGGRAMAVGMLTITSACAACGTQQSSARETAATRAAEGRSTIDRAALERLVDSAMARGMAAEQIPGAVFILVQDGRTVLAKGYGVADVDSRRPVSPDSTIWRVGSITKVFTAAAVMQLADRGRVRLDGDVNAYLRRLRVPATYPEPVTVAHLLAHTAGFDELPGVRLAPSREALRPLHEFLPGHLVRVRPPGRVTSYSSFGMALAGLLVEEVSGLAYEEYLRRNLWAPLGMTRTHVAPTPADEAALATGYDVEGGAVRRAPYEWYHTTPAGAINATAADMGRFMNLLLGRAPGGASVLSDRARRDMLRRQATMHPLVPGWGYGLQENDLNGQLVFEHGGDIAGFSALMTLLPEHGVGFFVGTHREGANLRFALEQALLDRFYPDRRPLAPPAPSGTRASAERFVGTYRWNIYCRSCATPNQLPSYTVTANDDGSIGVAGKRWVESSPLFFRSADGKERLGFATDSTGRVVHLTGGSWRVMERVR